jgi:hypothetical protein
MAGIVLQRLVDTENAFSIDTYAVTITGPGDVVLEALSNRVYAAIGNPTGAIVTFEPLDTDPPTGGIWILTGNDTLELWLERHKSILQKGIQIATGAITTLYVTQVLYTGKG